LDQTSDFRVPVKSARRQLAGSFPVSVGVFAGKKLARSWQGAGKNQQSVFGLERPVMAAWELSRKTFGIRKNSRCGLPYRCSPGSTSLGKHMFFQTNSPSSEPPLRPVKDCGNCVFFTQHLAEKGIRSL
jgi:hypothetical protein